MSLLEAISEDSREMAANYVGELALMGVTFTECDTGYNVDVPPTPAVDYERVGRLVARLAKLTGLGWEVKE